MSTDAPIDWRRTSPLAVIIFVTRVVRQLLTQGLPALVPLLAVFAAVEGLRWYWLAFVLLAIAGALLGWAVLSYLRFQFCVVDGRILVRQGVLHREQLDIEFHRVQNVSIKEPFYMRPLGLAVLSVDTAGSQEKEITLGGIDAALARRIRDTVLLEAVRPQAAGDAETAATDDPAARHEQAGRTGPDAGARSLPAAPVTLLERDPGQIARYGLTVNGFIWIAAGLGVVAGVAEDLLTSRVEAVIDAAIGATREGNYFFVSLLALVPVAVVLLVPLLSMAGAVVRYHGYRLSLDGETYRRSSGLFSRHEDALKRHKIQAVVRKQNFVARWLGMVTLKLEVARSGAGDANPSGIPTKASFLVPALDPGESERLIAEFLPGCESGAPEFSRPDAPRFIGKALLLNWTPPILAVTLPSAIFAHALFLLLIPVAYAAAFGLVWRRWSRWGYAVNGEYAFVRTGFLGTSVRIFPLFKSQRVDLRQTPGQRRARLAHLTLHLASASLTIPQVRLDDARRIRDLALYHAEMTSRSWY